MMEEDATTVCGARHRRHGDRRGYRWGRTHSEIGYHGGKVKVARPRVRDRAGKEVSLESWQALRDGNLLLEGALNLMVLNVSTRKYHRAVRLPEGEAYEFANAAFPFGMNGAPGAMYGSTLIMATGLHALHVVIGAIFLTVCMFRAMAGHFTPQCHFGFEAYKQLGIGTSSSSFGCSSLPASQFGAPASSRALQQRLDPISSNWRIFQLSGVFLLTQ